MKGYSTGVQRQAAPEYMGAAVTAVSQADTYQEELLNVYILFIYLFFRASVWVLIAGNVECMLC